jgi:hypothetical protein
MVRKPFNESIYMDTGCEVAPSCLNCPLPLCKYDDPWGYQRYVKSAWDLEVKTATESERLSVEQAAERFNVTVRTIFRSKQRVKHLIATGRGTLRPTNGKSAEGGVRATPSPPANSLMAGSGPEKVDRGTPRDGSAVCAPREASLAGFSPSTSHALSAAEGSGQAL